MDNLTLKIHPYSATWEQRSPVSECTLAPALTAAVSGKGRKGI